MKNIIHIAINVKYIYVACESKNEDKNNIIY